MLSEREYRYAEAREPLMDYQARLEEMQASIREIKQQATGLSTESQENLSVALEQLQRKHEQVEHRLHAFSGQGAAGDMKNLDTAMDAAMRDLETTYHALVFSLSGPVR